MAFVTSLACVVSVIATHSVHSAMGDTAGSTTPACQAKLNDFCNTGDVIASCISSVHIRTRDHCHDKHNSAMRVPQACAPWLGTFALLTPTVQGTPCKPTSSTTSIFDATPRNSTQHTTKRRNSTQAGALPLRITDQAVAHAPRTERWWHFVIVGATSHTSGTRWTGGATGRGLCLQTTRTTRTARAIARSGNTSAG
jgi:hypothetical protein